MLEFNANPAQKEGVFSADHDVLEVFFAHFLRFLCKEDFRTDFLYRGAYCAHTSPLPLLPSGPGGVGGIASRRARHWYRISPTFNLQSDRGARRKTGGDLETSATRIVYFR